MENCGEEQHVSFKSVRPHKKFVMNTLGAFHLLDQNKMAFNINHSWLDYAMQTEDLPLQVAP